MTIVSSTSSNRYDSTDHQLVELDRRMKANILKTIPKIDSIQEYIDAL